MKQDIQQGRGEICTEPVNAEPIVDESGEVSQASQLREKIAEMDRERKQWRTVGDICGPCKLKKYGNTKCT